MADLQGSGGAYHLIAHKRASIPPVFDARDLLVTAEVAEILHVDTSRVRRYCESGDLKAKKIGGNWIVKKEDLEAFKLTRRRIGRPNKEPAT